MIPIGTETKVTLNFELKLTTGEVVDSNFGSDPVSFSVGDGKLLPGFEKVLFGLVSGEEKEVTLAASEAFGPHNSDNVQNIQADTFPTDTELEVGMVMAFSDAAQGEVPGVITKIGEQYVTVDFNHPLAGRDILFSVKIVDVSQVQTH